MMDRVVGFLCKCSGVPRDALLRAPSARAQAAIQGTLLLLVPSFAMLSGSYALYRAFLGDPFAWALAAAIGVLWGGTVYCIDRSLVASIDASAPPLRRALQFVVRLPLATIVALVISMPLVLKVAERPIEAELRRQERRTVSDETRANAEYERLGQWQQTVNALKVDMTRREERLRGEPDTFEYRLAAEGLADAERLYQATLASNTRRIAAALREIDQIEELRLSRDLTRQEQEQLQQRRRRITVWRADIARANSARARARAVEAQTRQAWLDAERGRLDRVEQELEDARRRAGSAIDRVGLRDADSERVAARLMVPSLANQFTVFRRITADGGHPDAPALRRMEWSLHILFFVVEMLVVGLKVLNRKGPLEAAMAALEFEEEEGINLAANASVARRQAVAAAAARVEEQALRLWETQRISALGSRKLGPADLKQLRRDLDDLAA